VKDEQNASDGTYTLNINRNEIASGAKIPVIGGSTQSTSSEDGLKSTQSAQKLVRTNVRAHVLVVPNQPEDVSLGHPMAETVPLTLHPPSGT
jgi:hypothetical protein